MLKKLLLMQIISVLKYLYQIIVDLIHIRQIYFLRIQFLLAEMLCFRLILMFIIVLLFWQRNLGI